MVIILIQWQNSETITINNTTTSAIIEDSSDVLNYFADKYIITKYKLATGDLVEYAGITYIITSQIDRNYENRKENQYNYRARMKQADFNIKFIIDDELEIIPSIIEGQTFTIAEDKIFDVSTDKIIVTIQDNNISNQLKKEDRLIKFGRAFKIVGVDKTKKGLVALICQEAGASHLDDKKNEIADRWIEIDGKLIDRLPHFDNQEPEPEEPEEPEIADLSYSIEIEKQYQGDTEYQLSSNNWQTYTVKKLVDNEEVYGSFHFVLSESIEGLTLTKESDNTCKLSSVVIYGKFDIQLIITDTDTNEVIIEQNIFIKGR